MLLHPTTLELAPVARQLLERVRGDDRFKLELPASQLESVTSPAATVPEAIARLASARSGLANAADGLCVPAVAPVHPLAPARGELNDGPRYSAIRSTYGQVAERQLVASLQVHVAVGGAERSLAVYNALRAYLPELIALSANGPFYEGADTGLATVRPLICQLLPRQGVPPPLESWEELAGELRWLEHDEAGASAAGWWWELRPHPLHGTLELRVPDAQTSLNHAAGVTTFAQALAATLAERHDHGEALPRARGWRIAENRFSAIRHGLDGMMADLVTGRRIPTRQRLGDLLDEVTPAAERLGAASFTGLVRTMIASNGALAQRRVAAEFGPGELPRWLSNRYLEPVDCHVA